MTEKTVGRHGTSCQAWHSGEGDDEGPQGRVRTPQGVPTRPCRPLSSTSPLSSIGAGISTFVMYSGVVYLRSISRVGVADHPRQVCSIDQRCTSQFPDYFALRFTRLFRHSAQYPTINPGTKRIRAVTN